MKKARYIVVEGVEGVGKTTQTNLVAQHLMAKGYNVLLTKEPGTPHAPITMILRSLMLDKQYDDQLSISSRELISQAIRSIHLDKVVYPAMSEYDFIIQDRGILSGLSYGMACGNNQEFLSFLAHNVTGQTSPFKLYDDIIYLKGNVAKGLDKAKNAKQEFTSGDAIEAKGVTFMQQVASNMDNCALLFNGVRYINVDNKSIEEVTKDIFDALGLKEEDNGYKES